MQHVRLCIMHYPHAGNGMIDFREFVNLMTSRRRQSIDDEREMRDAFRALDRAGTGYVGPDNLRMAMSGLTGETVTDDEVKAMIRKADRDGDGLLNYEGIYKELI